MQQSFKTLMTIKRTFPIKQEGIVGAHGVLALPCCLLNSSILPQHLYKPHGLSTQNLLSAIHDTHWSLLEGSISINNKLSPIHYMSWIKSVLLEHRDVKHLMNARQTRWQRQSIRNRAHPLEYLEGSNVPRRQLPSFSEYDHSSLRHHLQEDMITRLEL